MGVLPPTPMTEVSIAMLEQFAEAAMATTDRRESGPPGVRAWKRPLVAFQFHLSAADHVGEKTPPGGRLKGALLEPFEPEPDGPQVALKDVSLMALAADAVANDTE